MPNELVKDNIVIDRKIGKEKTQILLEGDIIVPDIKPDMAVMLQTEATIAINKVEVSTDRINYMGKMEVSVLYLAKGNEKPVHSMSITTHIDDFIHMEGITKEMWADVKAEITNIDYKMLNDRKINYRAVVDIMVKAESAEVCEVVVDIQDLPPSQCVKTMLNLNKSVECKEDQFVVKDEISIPSGKPNMREILQCSIDVSTKDIRVHNGKVSINGELLVTTLYKGDDDDSLIEFIENEIPFNGVVEVAKAKEDMFADVSLGIQEKYFQIRSDADGEDRVVEIEVTILALIKVNCIATVEVLEDAYMINQNLDISKMPVKYPKLVCRNKNQAPIKEVIPLDVDCPEMLQIYRVTGKPHLEEIKVLEDKIVVEGMIETNILYLAESDDTPLYSYNSIIPYRQVIETKGTTPNMDVNIAASIDHTGFNMLSGKEVEIRFLMSFNTQVNQEISANMITDIGISEMSKDYLENFASITVYSVQKGDTLWKIAKRYNTTVEDIATVNGIQEPDKIYPNQKLLIIKKVHNE